MTHTFRIPLQKLKRSSCFSITVKKVDSSFIDTEDDSIENALSCLLDELFRLFNLVCHFYCKWQKTVIFSLIVKMIIIYISFILNFTYINIYIKNATYSIRIPFFLFNSPFRQFLQIWALNLPKDRLLIPPTEFVLKTRRVTERSSSRSTKRTLTTYAVYARRGTILTRTERIKWKKFNKWTTNIITSAWVSRP